MSSKMSDEERKRISIFGFPENSLGFLLWQVNNLWQKKQQSELKKINLTHVQFVLLASVVWLSTEDKKINQVTLSRFAKTDKMMTSQVIRKLVEKRLIIRYRNSEDSREFILEATEKGLNIAKRAIKIVETVDVNFFNSINEQDRKSLVSILLRLSLNGISLDNK